MEVPMYQSDRNMLLKSILQDKDTYSLLFESKHEQDAWFKRVQKSPANQPLINEIKEEAERLLNEPMQELSYSLFKIFSETGSRLEYERIYFARRRHLNTFVLMTLLQPENNLYKRAMHDVIWSICNEYTWCLPAHLKGISETKRVTATFDEEEQHTIDLFAAETAFTLSEIFQLTKDLLDPLLRHRIIQEIYRRVLRPFKNQSYGWETATHNWASVCAGSVGATALHLLDDESELAHVLDRVLKTMDYYLEGFNDDGTCLEGYGYWQYGFGYYVYFADLLKKKTKNQVNLFNQEKVHQIALFQQKTFLYKSTVVNFSDAQPSASVFLGLSHYLAHLYDDVDIPETALRAPYTEDHTSRWAPAFRNLLWFDPQLVGHPWRDESYYLEKSEWLVSRHVTEGTQFSFAAKGGHNAEPHNHNDIGHFILQCNDEVFLKDLGNGLYNDEYFGDKRYDFFCNGSHGHSVPIINGERQQEGEKHQAVIQNANINQEIIHFKMDMTQAYLIPTLEQLTRSLTWEKTESPILTLTDHYKFTDNPTSVIERLITPVLEIESDADGIMLRGNEKLKITYDQNKLALKITELDFMNHFGVKEHFLALDFSLQDLQQEFTVELAFQFL